MISTLCKNTHMPTFLTSYNHIFCKFNLLFGQRQTSSFSRPSIFFPSSLFYCCQDIRSYIKVQNPKKLTIPMNLCRQLIFHSWLNLPWNGRARKQLIARWKIPSHSRSWQRKKGNLYQQEKRKLKNKHRLDYSQDPRQVQFI